MIQVVVNGKPRDLSDGMAVSVFLSEQGVDPRQVVVEVNGEILPSDQFPKTQLKPGDVVEVVTMVGGG